MSGQLPSVDGFLGRSRAKGYDCLDFAREVWLVFAGEDLHGRMDGLFMPAEDREIRPEHVRAFRKIAAPVSPCLVLMRRPQAAPHLGVFVAGRILHLRERAEHTSLDVAGRGFERVEFYL